METENIDRLFLELSQVTKATTEKELRLEEQKAMMAKHIARLTDEINKICMAITGHCPRDRCTTAEAVEWLVDRHKAATAALYKLEEIRTEKIATKGLPVEASAVSAARMLLRSQREAAESADEKSDGQAENSIIEQHAAFAPDTQHEPVAPKETQTNEEL